MFENAAMTNHYIEIEQNLFGKFAFSYVEFFHQKVIWILFFCVIHNNIVSVFPNDLHVSLISLRNLAWPLHGSSYMNKVISISMQKSLQINIFETMNLIHSLEIWKLVENEEYIALVYCKT